MTHLFGKKQQGGNWCINVRQTIDKDRSRSLNFKHNGRSETRHNESRWAIHNTPRGKMWMMVQKTSNCLLGTAHNLNINKRSSYIYWSTTYMVAIIHTHNGYCQDVVHNALHHQHKTELLFHNNVPNWVGFFKNCERKKLMKEKENNFQILKKKLLL